MPTDEKSDENPNVSNIVDNLRRNAATVTDRKWEPRKDIPAAIAILRDVAILAALAWAGVQSTGLL